MIAHIKDSQRLMFITHPSPTYTETDEVRMVLEGGCRWIQLRMKQSLDKKTVEEVVRLCRSHGSDAICCINDNVEMALACGASAVHIGKSDMPVAKARQLAAQYSREDSFFIGATANTFDDIRQAYEEGASYIGLGPYRYTETKNNLSPILGPDGYRNILEKCKAAAIEIPIFAIGGITSDDVQPLRTMGVSGVAVSGSIIRASDPIAEARRFLHLINT